MVRWMEMELLESGASRCSLAGDGGPAGFAVALWSQLGLGQRIDITLAVNTTIWCDRKHSPPGGMLSYSHEQHEQHAQCV